MSDLMHLFNYEWLRRAARQTKWAISLGNWLVVDFCSERRAKMLRSGD